jgi:hypothetical protein
LGDRELVKKIKMREKRRKKAWKKLLKARVAKIFA